MKTDNLIKLGFTAVVAQLCYILYCVCNYSSYGKSVMTLSFVPEMLQYTAMSAALLFGAALLIDYFRKRKRDENENRG